MAQSHISLQPPPPFDFKSPDEWSRWRRRFEQFRIASGLADSTADKQISTLLYCLGEDAESVLTSTNATEEDRKDYDKVLKLFDDFFQVRRNIIFERARFNRRNQLPDESAEQYIMALYALAANCNYGALEHEMIRDRLVVGIRDTALSERLQLDAELTLEKAKKAIRQREAVQQQQSILIGTDRCNVDAVRPINHHRRQRKRPESQYRASRALNSNGDKSKVKSQPKLCMRCGKEPHAYNKCPAKDATCRKCQRKGHYSSQCRSKHVDESGLETTFLDATTSSSPTGETAWFVKVCVGRHAKKEVTFKLDTGAEVTAISQETYQELPNAPSLSAPQRTLCGPSRRPLQVLGQCQIDLSHKELTSNQQVFVVKGLRSNLLGLPAIRALNLAVRIDETTTTTTPLSSTHIYNRFRRVFHGLGNLGEEYHIRLKPGATPFALYAPRRVPLPLRKKVSEELQRMETMGVISRVDVPTPWCAGIVVVPKKSGSVRICVDLKPLNQSVLREFHPLPKVDETLAQLTGAKLFSKLDANSGFWQIPLSPASRLLTTFITPFGRYCFNKLPFGISSAPEHFQKRMSQILTGLEGVVCQMDDVLVFGINKTEHDSRLLSVLKRIEASGVTLNITKCEFSKTSITFLGHQIDQDGIRADPDKTLAIRDMRAPTTVPELRRFLGMANQLGKFTPKLANLTQPLRGLLSKSTEWTWGPDQREAFTQVKEELSKPTTLAFYDCQAPTKVSADASSYGLGAVLMQEKDKQWKPVAYASRSMSDTERRYAQIEKEALAITWACEKFSEYILGKMVTIETDHKPLVPLLTSKQLDSLPARVLRFRLRMDRFTYSIHHVPGKKLNTADTLSRAPLISTVRDQDLEELAEMLTSAQVEHLPASKERLEQYRQAQHSDATCSTLMEYCRNGWPDRDKLTPNLVPFWPARGELTIGEDLLLYGNRLVVPRQMQAETLRKLHQGHQGIQRCRLRANISVWWPGIARQIYDFISQCPECCKDASPRREPLMPTPLPEFPWQKAATDLFELKGETYLIVVDYFSRFPEVIQLRSTTSLRVINALQSIFARHGIPEELVSDNGPQFSSREFSEFATTYGFKHTTSSPYYPQGNGQAERMVKTVKKLLKRSPDQFLALLSYRSTPLPWCRRSPAELCLGRNLRTDIPQARKNLIPGWAYLKRFREDDKVFKSGQKKNFDKRHCTKPLPELLPGTAVWITTDGQDIQGVANPCPSAPRSYMVTTPSGTIRRNRSQLNVIPDSTETSLTKQSTEGSSTKQSTKQSITTSTRQPIMTRSRTGTQIVPPQRF